MQLNTLFGFLGKSFLPQGEQAATIADDGDGPSGFGSALATAFGLVASPEAAESPKDLTPAADGTLAASDEDAAATGETLAAGDGDAADGEETPSALHGKSGSSDDSAHAADLPPTAGSARTADASSPGAEDAASPGGVAGAADEDADSPNVVSDSPGAAADFPAADDVSQAEAGAAWSSAEGVPASTETEATSASDQASERPSDPTAPSGDPNLAERGGHAAASGGSPPSIGASESLSASAHGNREGASNPPETAPASSSRPTDASPEDGAHAQSRASDMDIASTGRPSHSEEGLTADRSAAADLQHNRPEKATDTISTQALRADLSRAAQPSAGPTISRSTEAATTTAGTEAPPRPSEATSDGRNSPLPNVTASSTAASSNGVSVDTSAELPVNVESVRILEGGAEADSTANGIRRGEIVASSTILGRASSAAANDTLFNGASHALNEETSSEVRTEPHMDEDAPVPSTDGATVDDLEAALKGSDDGMRRSSSPRADADGDRRASSGKPQAAGHQEQGFSQGNFGSFSDSQGQESSFHGNRPGTAGSASSDFEHAVDEQLVDAFSADGFSRDEVGADVKTTSHESAFTPEQRTMAAGAMSMDAAQGSLRSRAPGTISWLRSMLAQSARSLPLEQGWKAIEVKLEEGMGTMTVRARRGDDGVRIAVSFSDPQLRSLAEAGVHRLQDVLQAEYETEVDLSLASDGSSDSPEGRGQSEPGRPSPAPVPTMSGSDPNNFEDAQARRAALPGTRNEWIG